LGDARGNRPRRRLTGGHTPTVDESNGAVSSLDAVPDDANAVDAALTLPCTTDTKDDRDPCGATLIDDTITSPPAIGIGTTLGSLVINLGLFT
jgi:hypothetical protein